MDDDASPAVQSGSPVGRNEHDRRIAPADHHVAVQQRPVVRHRVVVLDRAQIRGAVVAADDIEHAVVSDDAGVASVVVHFGDQCPFVGLRGIALDGVANVRTVVAADRVQIAVECADGGTAALAAHAGHEGPGVLFRGITLDTRQAFPVEAVVATDDKQVAV